MTPKFFNGSWDQSNANSSHRVSREPHDEPIHNALVLATFIFNPDSMQNCLSKFKAAF